jgi:hypothetical protein
MSFDIVIPVGPHDMNRIHEQIKYTKKNIMDYRNIYIISSNPTLTVENCITIDETIFPFSKKDIETYHGQSDRNGWYLQQLLKLYAGQVIPNILNNYLIIDSDTFFLKPTLFIDPNDGKYLYNFSDKENHIPYYEHMTRLHEKFKKIHKHSGICHHMMYDNKIIQEIFTLTEDKHKKSFWIAFLELVNEDLRHNSRSGASEYELYFNYVLNYHFDKVKIRILEWDNLNNWNKINTQYDYVSFHWYMNQ